MIIFTMRRLFFSLAFFVIVLLAAGVRFYKLGSVPYSLYWDETAIYVDVKSVLQSGLDMHGRPWFQVIYPSYGDFKLPVYIWLAEASSKVFGLSEMSLRLPSALAGIGTVVIGGLVVREMLLLDLDEQTQAEKKKRQLRFAQLAQLVTMLIIATSPWSIMFSRTGFEGHVGQFFLALSIYFVLRARKNWKYVFLSPIFGVIATYSYYSVRFVWIGVFVVAVLIVLWEHIARLIQSKSFLRLLGLIVQMWVLPIILFSLLMLPMLRSPLYADTNTFRLSTPSVLNHDYVTLTNTERELAGNSRIDRLIFNPRIEMVKELLKHYSDNLSLNFMFVTGDPNLRHGTTHDGLFALFLLPFLFFGLFKLFEKSKPLCLLLVVWWIFALLPASAPDNTPHALRSLNALVPLASILAIGVTAAIVEGEKYLSKFSKFDKFSKSFAMFPMILFLLFTAISTFAFLYHYFLIYPHESANDWQNGYKQLALSVVDKTKTGQQVYVNFDDRFYLWLMAYGPYTADDFHHWKSRDYKFSNDNTFDHVTFRMPSNGEMTAGSPLWLVGPKNLLDDYLGAYKTSKKPIRPDETQQVSGDDGTPRFELLHFTP